MSFPPLKFLIDVGVGRAVEQFLEQQGYEVKTVRSLDSRRPDIDIIRLAVPEERLIMTMDKDFGELVYHLQMPHCGITSSGGCDWCRESTDNSQSVS